MKRAKLPIALTIAGSDSGGGAGLQADLKTFAALGVHGTSVTTCLTAQNPCEVAAIQGVPPAFVREQLATLFRELAPQAAKTGMLFSLGLVREVARWWADHPKLPLVVDPVMVSTSGARLLKPSAQHALMDELFPRAILITPNVDEAELIVGRRIQGLGDLATAGQICFDRWGCAALMKGGHLKNQRMAVDLLFDGRQHHLLSAEFVKGVATHGTGCTYSAAITSFLAQGGSLVSSVKQAKQFITLAIRHSILAGGHFVLNPTRAGLG